MSVCYGFKRIIPAHYIFCSGVILDAIVSSMNKHSVKKKRPAKASTKTEPERGSSQAACARRHGSAKPHPHVSRRASRESLSAMRITAVEVATVHSRAT